MNTNDPKDIEFLEDESESIRIEPSVQMPPSPRRKRKKPWWILLVILVVLLAVGAGTFLWWRGGITMKATLPEGETVSPTTAFVITLRDTLSEQELRQQISCQPAIGFLLEPQGEDSFLLTPAQTLSAGARLNVTVKNQTFAFTVSNTVVVTSNFPTNGSANVPIYSGVEIYFNTESISTEDFETNFRIDPPLPGSFWSNEGGISFSSEGNMYYDTEYTITLAKGLHNATGATLPEDFTLRFRTVTEEYEADYNSFRLSSSKVSYNFTPEEAPYLELYLIADSTEEVSAQVEVFQIPTAEDYIAQLEDNIEVSHAYYQREAMVATEGLVSHATMELPLLPMDSPYGYQENFRMLEFPEPLEQGWYAVEMSVELSQGAPITRRALFQVSSVSVFYMLANDTMMAWVNDTNTGQPLDGAEFQVTGGFNAKGTADLDGIVTLEEGVYLTPSQVSQKGGIFTVATEDILFADMEDFYYWDNSASKIANQYISYLFTDRPIYRTTDTIQCWGVLRPRAPGTPPPENISLSLDDGAISVPVALEEDGTFTAEIDYSYLTASFWKQLKLVSTVEEQEITYYSTHLRIEDYVKPVYTGSSGSDKPVYQMWEDSTASVSASVTTFDGTPSSQMEFALQGNEALLPSRKDILTNASGQMDIDVSLEGLEDKPTWYPQSYEYYFASSGPLDEPFTLYNTLYVIHRDLLLMGTPDLSGENPTVEITTHQIDTSSIATTEDLWKKDSLKGRATTTEVTAQLYEVTYEKVITGDYYDYINKVRKDTYRYEKRETLKDTFRVQTQNGSYLLENLPIPQPGGYHYLLLTAQDSHGKQVETTVYLGYAYDMQGARENLLHNYTLSKRIDSSRLESEFVQGEWQEPNIWQLQNTFGDQEAVTFDLTDNDEVVTQPTGRVFYAVVQDDVITSGISREPVTLSFEEGLVPNYMLSGAYFDGKYVYMLQDNYMSFQSDNRQLTIALETDKDSYRPAETMKVSATVTDQQGDPVPDTQVLLSVVDEAIFAMEEQDTDILSRLYQAVYFPTIYKYGSYRQQRTGGAEKGGGGGDQGVRTDFLDTAEFTLQKTDATGKAELTVALPDNITSWRLTSLALDQRNFAGDIRDNRVVTQPFFVTPVLPSQILLGDTLAVGLRSAGTSVDADTNVRYTIEVAGENTSEVQTVTLPARTYGTVLFEKLPVGEYTVTIGAESEKQADTVQLPVACVATGNEVTLARTLPLSEVADSIQPLRYPVSLSIYDKEQAIYQSIISSIQRDAEGSRSDMRLARQWLGARFEESGTPWYDTSWRAESISDLSGYNLLSLFPYSENDIELTVKAHLAAPKMLTRSVLSEIKSFGEYSGSPAIFYLAQAMSEQPIFEDLSYILEQDASLSYVEKIYLTLALYQSGQEKEAKGFYDQLVKKNLKEYSLLSGETSYYIEVSGEDSDACTGAASLLASVMQTREAEDLVRTLAEKGSQKDPYLLERMVFINHNTPAGKGTEVSYTIDGNTTTHTLEHAPLTLTLSKEQLEQASFHYKGEVWADVSFASAASERLDSSKEKIGVVRTISKADGSTGPYKVGDLLRVDLALDFSQLESDFGQTGVYVEEYLPTGTRYVGATLGDLDDESQRNARNWNMNLRQGQRVQLSMFPYGSTYPYTQWEDEMGWWDGSNTYTYYILCITPGTYVVEGAVATSHTSAVWGITTASQMVIADE